MIIPGRDRYCQKVTRRQGNGLQQPARFDEGRGWEKKDPEEDGETEGGQSKWTKKKQKTKVNIFKAIKHFQFSPLTI